MRKIDAFNHIFPRSFLSALEAALSDTSALKRMASFPTLYDLDARLRAIEPYADYQQVLAMSGPQLEVLVDPRTAHDLARLANDELADICRRYPDRFPAFVACLPLGDPDLAWRELERAIGGLGARGIQVFSNVAGVPLDDPRFAPLFERMASHDLPILIHPDRGPAHSDYASEAVSRFEIWFTFGWPYESSAAMTRLVMSGALERWPTIKILTHHMGGMIPFFAGRVGIGMDELGTRTSDPRDRAAKDALTRRPVDYFRRFYADTAVNGSSGALRCGIDFFGIERCLFATDFPFDPEGGTMFVRETIAAIEGLSLASADLEALYAGNARRLFHLT